MKQRWCYYIPHDWQGVESTIWEDIYLCEEGMAHEGSIWLTIEALGTPDTIDLSSGPGIGESEYEYKKKLLGDKDIVCDDNANMFVREDELTLKQLLHYAELWLTTEEGAFDIELVAVEESYFDGSNTHACALQEAREILATTELEEETLN